MLSFKILAKTHFSELSKSTFVRHLPIWLPSASYYKIKWPKEYGIVKLQVRHSEALYGLAVSQNFEHSLTNII